MNSNSNSSCLDFLRVDLMTVTGWGQFVSYITNFVFTRRKGTFYKTYKARHSTRDWRVPTYVICTQRSADLDLFIDPFEADVPVLPKEPPSYGTVNNNK
jgi:hypothetical protein